MRIGPDRQLHAARRALFADRSNRSGLELIPKKHPFDRACSLVRYRFHKPAVSIRDGPSLSPAVTNSETSSPSILIVFAVLRYAFALKGFAPRAVVNNCAMPSNSDAISPL